ncbi:MAG: CehA/McbA family metallohydrolase [Planctomycetaceae bacterium]|nr:CehA/McbA family metallohydrolase [Planctomycetaceae bacterium]
MIRWLLTILVSRLFLVVLVADAKAQNLDAKVQPRDFVGTLVDADTHQPVAARIYLQDARGEWLFVRSASDQGTAWPYAEEWVPMPDSVERHTTVSAHPFHIRLEPGEYQLLIERGKEYWPLRETIVIQALTKPDAATGLADQSIEKTFELRRWSHMAQQGWYSGETHVHRRIAELPNVMSAEELNVTFPVTFWTTSSDNAPDLEPSALRSQGPSPFGPREDHGSDPIWVNDHQVILPRNTEYEIFSVGNKRHTLGALFILNHRTRFMQTVPPLRSIVEQSKREGALLDLDKHNWPWSLMLVPVAQVDLFELANNSVWRTNFGFKQAGQALPPWAEFEQESPGVLTEWGWLQFGFEMYYALLNCGFRLSPSAGTASGVHPVPLGYSRVYVQTGEKFDLDKWLEGLKQGRSFVTTGPMLTARVNGQYPGTVFQVGRKNSSEFRWEAEVVSPDPISRVEVIVNGQVKYGITPEILKTESGDWKWSGGGDLRFSATQGPASHGEPTESAWIAVRTWSDQPDGRKRFAHTGAWYVDVDQQPMRPPVQQIDYLLQQLERSLENQRGVLSPEALDEFEQARDVYRRIQATAYVQPATQLRPTSSEAEERFWLENMAIWHHYSLIEMSQVLGKHPEEVRELLTSYGLVDKDQQSLRPKNRLAIAPYPGGRHPRRGFLDGAIAPQRETKFSVFTPWSNRSYIVADVPEAIFSNLGLIYLAHTHIPTIWDEQQKSLPIQEWQRQEGGVLKSERSLPNGIRFEVTIIPNADHVRMELTLFNGTSAPLSGLRVQHCMMLAHADEFLLESNDNKLFHGDYGLVHNAQKNRWMITSWKPLGRAWGNPPVPCLHADPVLPDCPVGETTRTQGWLSFYEGEDWQSELQRIEALRWWE